MVLAAVVSLTLTMNLTLYDHLSVLLFCRADETVPPVNFHPLSPMKLQQLFAKYLSRLGKFIVNFGREMNRTSDAT